MTGHDDLDRRLKRWFDEDAGDGARTGLLETVVAATARRRSRPAFIVALRGGGMDARRAGSSSGARSLSGSRVRWSTALVLLLAIAALVAGVVLVGARLFQPSPLPTGRLGHLAYGLDGDIYVADWDGGNRVRIADGVLDPGGGGPAGCGSFWGEGPMWSPDGRYLAYRSAWDDSCRAASGEGKVYLTDPEGHPVASFSGAGWLVSWSPDSTRVATWIDLGNTIGVYGIDGVRQELLSVPPGCKLPGNSDPIWSPDGMSLVVASCVVPLDGRTPRKAPANDLRSRWWVTSPYSRDGSRAAYTDDPSSASLVVARADGTVLRILAGAQSGSNGYGAGPVYQNPVLSRTGDRVAFVWSPAVYDEASDPSLIHEIFEIRMLDVASGTVMTLVRTSGGEHLAVQGFSPEGDRLLYSRSDANYVGTSLESVRADGSDAQPLVTGTGWGDWQWQQAGP